MRDKNINKVWMYIETLLQDRPALFKAIDSEKNTEFIMQAMLLTIFVGAAAFGVAVGSYRGGLQMLYSGIKFPLVVLLTAAICAPVLTSFEVALGQKARWRRDLLLVASAMALGSLALTALAPVIVLGDLFDLEYHSFILLIGGTFVVAGMTVLGTLLSGISLLSQAHALGRALAVLAVLAIVGMQMSWTFRPYVLRPRAQNVPFMRALDGSLLDAALTSWHSARGIYSREQAPLPEGS